MKRWRSGKANAPGMWPCLITYKGITCSQRRSNLGNRKLLLKLHTAVQSPGAFPASSDGGGTVRMQDHIHGNIDACKRCFALDLLRSIQNIATVTFDLLWAKERQTDCRLFIKYCLTTCR